jgi:hypothetical protein
MSERIITDSNGRKHITSEPLLHKHTQQKPLSEEWVAHCWRKSIIGTRIHYVDYLALVRETERAHGIKEKK